MCGGICPKKAWATPPVIQAMAYPRAVSDSWRVDETYIKVKANGFTSIARSISRVERLIFS